MIRASTARRRFLLLVAGANAASRAALDLGEVNAPGAALPLAFDRFLLLETMPV